MLFFILLFVSRNAQINRKPAALEYVRRNFQLLQNFDILIPLLVQTDKNLTSMLSLSLGGERQKGISMKSITVPAYSSKRKLK